MSKISYDGKVNSTISLLFNTYITSKLIGGNSFLTLSKNSIMLSNMGTLDICNKPKEVDLW